MDGDPGTGGVVTGNHLGYFILIQRASGKTEYLHTLNGSGLATSRIFPALVEQNQNADGSVTVPEVLRRYIGLDCIRK